MADNTTFTTTVATPPSGTIVAAREATLGGDTALAQVVTLVAITGSEGAYTVREVFYADDAAFTPATGGVIATGMLFDDVAPDSVDEGDIGIGRMSARREAYIQIRDAAGNERGLNVDASGNITVNVTGTVTVGSHAVTNAGTFAVQDAAAEASLSVLDDWDETNRAAVNTIAGQVGVQGASGIATALTQRVVLATDVALPAGTNAIGKLAANSGVDIGDVDVLSIAAGTNTIGAAVTSGHATAGTGLSTLFDGSGDNTAQALKTAAGRLYFLEVSNPTAADAYIQLFDLATASVTVGTTAPKLSLFVPAGDGTLDGAMDKVWEIGLHFATAITYACTTTPTGGTGPATALVVNAGYV